MGSLRRGAITRRAFVSSAGVGGLALLSHPAGSALPGVPEEPSASILACVPLAAPGRGMTAARETVAALRRAGAAAAVVPVIETEHLTDAMRALAQWRQMMSEQTELCVPGLEPIDWAPRHRGGRVALIAHSHGVQWLGRDLSLVPEFRALGLRITKLCSGWRSLCADGCFEATDLGLTSWGRDVVRALNHHRLVIDLAYTGRKSSLDAMRVSQHPVVFSHVNAAAVHAHPLNLTDEQIQACAKTGGVIGVSAFPTLLADAGATIDDFVRHVEYITRLVGIDHVALGLDFDTRRTIRFPTDPLPTGPYQYPKGVAGFADLAGLRSTFAKRGFNASARAAIFSGNLERVFRQVWDAA